MQEPAILTEYTVQRRAPYRSAALRARRAAQVRAEVAAWFASLGLHVTERLDVITGTDGPLIAQFVYVESASTRKHQLRVWLEEKRVTIRALRARQREQEAVLTPGARGV
jgi:mannose/fructose-specific phosphotransferase system component IIA